MKINKLSLLPIYISLVAILMLGACSTPAPAKPDLPPIRIGISSWIGFGSVYIADDQGFFAKEGVKVEVIKYTSYNTENSDFAARKLDGNAMVLSDSVTQVAAKIPVQVIWIFDSSNGGDVLVGNSSITSPADLKGKRIGLAYGTFGHIFVLSGLAKYGLSRDDVTIINVGAEGVPQALADGKIDAGHTWAAALQQALDNGGHSILTSADVPGAITDVLTFHTAILQDRPEDVKAILRALQVASGFWAKNPDEANKIIGKAMGVDPSIVPLILQGDTIYSLADQQALFDPNSAKSAHKLVQNISDFFIKEKVMEKAPDSQSVLNGTFAQALIDKK
jgi:NitT/TauT family transport system substrate-binding protein